MLAVCLDVIPTVGAPIGARAVLELLRGPGARRSRSRGLTGPVARLRRSTVVRHPEKCNLGVKRAKVAHTWHVKERARSVGEEVETAGRDIDREPLRHARQ